MLAAITKIVLILNLVTTQYEFNGPSEFVEAMGYASNEIHCKEAPMVSNPACLAYCNTQKNWFSDDDIVEENPVCTELI